MTGAKIRTRALPVFLAVVAASAVLTAAPPDAQAAGLYSNASIADRALRYVGQWGGEACRAAGKLDNHNTGRTVGGYGAGQCKTFVNCVVWLASGGTQYPAGGYSSGFKAAGGIEVTRGTAVKGDIIQVGESNTASVLHTAIVVQNKGGGVFNVVDSNFGSSVNNEMVKQHDWLPPSNARFWRMGAVTDSGTGGGVQTMTFLGTDQLANGRRIYPNQYLLSYDARWVLALQGDGNLVLYGPGYRPMWSSGTGGRSVDSLVVQGDGNIVLYGTGGQGALWATGTVGVSGAQFKVQDDGNVVVYDGAGTARWSTGAKGSPTGGYSLGTDTLNHEQWLRPNRFLRSGDGRYVLYMQGDGNLVLWSPGGRIQWASGARTNLSGALQQSDGNLVVYASPLWASNHTSSGTFQLRLQNDGNAVVYYSTGVALWSTGTAGRI
jgi:hypothetical protein